MNRLGGTARITRVTIALATALAVWRAAAAETPATTDQVPILPVNIAPTAATATTAQVTVDGKPRVTRGHPCTLWDQEDIDAIKVQLKTNTALQQQFALLKAQMDKRIAAPLGVPEPGTEPPTRDVLRMHSANSTTISDLGTMYALTGDERYGEYCRKMLVAYARAYPKLPHPAGWTEKRYRSAQDGRLTGQFLEDGFWLARVARGADLVYNLPSWTPEERKLVRDDLFEAIASQFYHPVIKGIDYLGATHNRSALCTSAVLMAGYASDNEKLVKLALYGVDGTPEKPTGGVFGTHFTEKCIFPDGLWNEGAPGYQLGITSCALVNDAETLWHHGIDLYRHNNGIFKRMLDSAIGLAYPDARMYVPALHDSGPLALLDERDWFSNEAGLPYEYGYRRYRDPAYIPIIRNAAKRLSMSVHSGPTSLFADLPDDSQVPPRRMESVNYPAVGYGVLRVPANRGFNQVLMEFGPSGSHGHPSKLAIDVYALDDALMPMPGVIYPYNDPMDPKWYWTTLGNCALTVDEKSQITWGSLWQYPRGTVNPEARQLVFGPAGTVGIQRARADNLYKEKVLQDRALFLTRNYMADLFFATGATPHNYDLAWHFRGKLATALDLAAYAFPEPVANGYNALTNVRRGGTDQAWSATVTTPKGQTARFFAAGGAATEVVTGDGHFIFNRRDEQPPTILQRRSRQDAVLFGSATDAPATPNRSSGAWSRKAEPAPATGCSRSRPGRARTPALRRTGPGFTGPAASKPTRSRRWSQRRETRCRPCTSAAGAPSRPEARRFPGANRGWPLSRSWNPASTWWAIRRRRRRPSRSPSRRWPE